MAREGWIDLIEEFTEHQKDNDIILLTTYKYDPAFFDIFILDRIAHNNPVSDIFILIDGDEYNRIYPLFTQHTGNHYHLIPIFAKNGVFHPKVFLFLSEVRGTISALIGSPNITLSGLTSNAEVVTKINSTINPLRSSIKELLDFFVQLAENGYIRDNDYLQTIHHLKHIQQNNTKDDNIRIFHNITEAILPRVTETVKESDNLFLFAPFWSNNTKVLETLIRDDTVKNIHLALQKNNHNLSRPELYKKFIEDHGIALSWFYADFEDSRRFHSKIIGFKGKSDYLLVGSSNLTESALLRNCVNGNFEVSILIHDDPMSTIQYMTLTPVPDVSDITTTATEFSREKTQSIVVYNVHFDLLKLILTIEMEKPIKRTTFHINFKDGSSSKDEVITQEKIQITCSKIPFEAVFEQNEIISKRRIFYDDGYFYKIIRRGTIGLDEIGKKVLSDCNIHGEDLLRVIYGLNRSSISASPSSLTTPSGTEKTKEKRFTGPSREAVVSNSNLLMRLAEVYRYIDMKKVTQKEQREVSDTEDNEEPQPKHLQRYKDNEVRKKLCLNFIRSVNEILNYKIAKDGYKPSHILSAMSLFAQSITRIIAPIYIDRDLMYEFALCLDKNLRYITVSSADIETRKLLFKNLVMANYVIGVNQRYTCVDHLFTTEEIVDPQFLDECKNYIAAQIEQLNIGRELNFVDLGSHAGLISGYIPNGYTVLDDILLIVRKANSFQSEEQLQFLRSFLGSVRRWSISPIANELREIADGLNEPQKQCILIFLDLSY